MIAVLEPNDLDRRRQAIAADLIPRSKLVPLPFNDQCRRPELHQMLSP
jgi:hypothetical protein